MFNVNTGPNHHQNNLTVLTQSPIHSVIFFKFQSSEIHNKLNQPNKINWLRVSFYIKQVTSLIPFETLPSLNTDDQTPNNS